MIEADKLKGDLARDDWEKGDIVFLECINIICLI